MRSLPLLLLCACNAAPGVEDMFHSVQLSRPATASEANAPFVSLIDGAESSLHIAISSVEDPSVTDALLAAHQRGVLVELVIDGDSANQAVADLEAAGVAVSHTDMGVGYFDFALNADVSWSSDKTIMSHNFAVADKRRFVTSTEAGRLADGTRLHLEGRGEDLIRDLLTEHNQLMGGVDATALTAFSAPAKSVADSRWMYPIDAAANFELWLGPQERVTKRIIDSTYGAMGSVWVVTDDLANEGLIFALEQKAAAGFDVRVVVGPNYATSYAPLSREFTNNTPNVQKRQVQDEVMPTFVLFDYAPSPVDQRMRERKAMILTHDLYSATRTYSGVEITSDQYIDGALWVLTDYNEREGLLDELAPLFEDYFARGGAL
ncbi:MAG: hypothetical protein EP330_28665 [Deltaproteobacteria bacterium]|nr:MAG: hypothetical protein EP330_28665 [Deltaproteobacteria bacterium]